MCTVSVSDESDNSSFMKSFMKTFGDTLASLIKLYQYI
jgi:hypothetical protein